MCLRKPDGLISVGVGAVVGGGCWATRKYNCVWGASADDGELTSATKCPAANAVLKRVSALAAPTVKNENEHACNELHSLLTHLTARVARPVPNTEMKEPAEALAACTKA